MIGPLASGSGGMLNVEVDGSGNYSAPNYTFKPYSKQIQVGDGTVRGAGWTVGTWVWDVMTDTQRDWLRTYIPAQSAELYIQTHTMDYNVTPNIYTCVGVWPIDTETHDATRRMKFEIKFQRMVKVG